MKDIFRGKCLLLDRIILFPNMKKKKKIKTECIRILAIYKCDYRC